MKIIALAASIAAVMVPAATVAQCAGGVCGGYGYGYGRPGTYNTNVTGAWPGSGPYDSSIATSGIMAGASVLNNIISSVLTPPPVVAPQPVTVVAQPAVSGQYGTVVMPAPGAAPGTARVISSGPVCSMAVLGYDSFGRAIMTPICQ